MATPAILFAGVPGTGKSSYARWPAKTHGFEHIDVENQRQSLESFAKSPTDFIAELLAHGSPICFDWGFPPECLAIVRQFTEAGFGLWRFDAEIAVAKRYFLQRGTVSEAASDRQVSLIAAFREQIYATMFPDDHGRAQPSA